MPFTAQDIDKIMRGEKTVGNFIGNIRKKTPTVTSGLPPAVSTPISAPKPALRPTTSPVIGTAPYAAKLSAPRLNPLVSTAGAVKNAANSDADLTPQEILKKYQAIAGDTSIHDRDALIKQGRKSLNDIVHQQVALPFLRPKINGTVNEDEIAQAIKLRDELSRQTPWGSAVLSAFNAASFGQLKNPVLGDKFAPEAVAEQRAAIQRAEQAQPTASTVGKFAGEAVKYGATAGIVNGIPAVQALGKGKLPARLLAGRLTDIVPDAVTAAQETDNAADFAKNLSWEQVKGLAFDGALEAVGAGAKWIVGKIKSKQPVSTMEVDQLRSAIADGVRKGDVDASAVNKAAQPKTPEIPKAQNAIPVQQSVDAPRNLYAVDQEVKDTVTGLKKTGRAFYRETVSGQAPLERLSKAQAKIESGMATADDYVQQVRNAGGTVDYVVSKGMVDRAGNPIDVSWKQMIDIPESDLKLLNEYMQNKHNIARQLQGKPVLDATAEESARRVSEIESAAPAIAKKAQQINQYWDKFMNEWAVKGNLLSRDQYDTMRKMYPDYVPTFRVDKDVNGATSLGFGRNIATAKVVKTAKGGISEVKPLENNFADQMAKFIKAEKKNELFLNLVDFVRKSPNAAAPYAKLTQPKSSNLLKEGLDGFVDDVDLKSLEEVKKGVYRLTAYENGKPISLNVSEEVFKALDSLLNPKTPAAVALGKKLTSVPKSLITGYNPFFAATNLIRDVQTGYINTISNRKMFATYTADLANAARDMAKNANDWKLYQANGGNRSGFFNIEKGFKESNKPVTSIVPKAIESVKKGASFLGENSEQIVRYNEFKNGLKKYGRTPDGIKKAMQAAADVTVNFSRNGPTTKAIDSWVMYLNAGVQGLDKMARQIKNNPLQTVRRASEIIAAPTAALWLINRGNPHYNDLDNRTKDNYFVIPNAFDRDGNGFAKSFIKLPKSREYGALLGATLERAGRVIDGEAPEEAFRGLKETYISNLGLSNPSTENILAPIFYNIPSNKDFAGRSIVPESMRDLEPRLQYDATTSNMAKGIANITNNVPIINKLPLHKSPKQIDYLINNYSGIVGDIVQPLTTGQPKTLPEAFKQATIKPLQRKFTANPLYQSGVVDKFYNDLDKATVIAKSENFEKDIPKEAKTPSEVKMSCLNKISKQISELRKREKALLGANITESERKPQIEAIRSQIIELSRNAGERAQAEADKYAKTYVQEISHLSDRKQNVARQLYKQGVPYNKYLTIQESADMDGNNSISQKELVQALDDSDLTLAQKAYFFKLQNEDWKSNPYQQYLKSKLPQSAFSKYYNVLIDVQSTKRINGKTIPNSLERNRRKALLDAGFTLQEANEYLKAMYG